MADRAESQPSEPPDPGGGQRGRNNRNQGNGNNGNRNRNAEADAKGRTKELRGYVYRIRSTFPAESFARTTREIGEYIARKIPNAGEYRIALQALYLRPLVPPAEPSGPVLVVGQDPDPPTAFQIKIWEMEYKTYENERVRREHNQRTVFPIVLGQCTGTLRTALESDPSYLGISAAYDVIRLLQLIQSKAFVGPTKGDHIYNAQQAENAWRGFKQPRTMELADYFHAFNDRLAN